MSENLDAQLAATPATWERVRAAGVEPGDRVELAYLFVARHRSQARELAGFLREHSDSEPAVKREGVLRRRWLVDGAVTRDAVDLPFLLEWVRWMVEAGERCGCVFDAWGTPVRTR